jgi:hypothetical protein
MAREVSTSRVRSGSCGRLVHFRTFRPVRRTAVWMMVAALLVAAGCGGDGDDNGPTATIAKPGKTSTTEAKTPEEQVEAAYLKSWDVYAKAVRELDTSRLEQIYAEEQLKRTTDEVLRLKAAGNAVRVAVEHDLHVEIVKDGLALVRDRYRNHSVLIDPQSGEPREQDPDVLLLETYTLKEIFGRWMVVDIVRESQPPS